MANKTSTNVQTKLNELALALPRLRENEQWTEVLHEVESLSQSTNRQELLLETVAAISDAASSILEVDDLLRVSVNLIQDYFDFYYVGIFLTDESNEWAVFRAGTGETGQIQLQKQHRLKINGNSLIGQCISKRQPVITLDVGKGAPQYSSPLLPSRSEIVLPLINRGQVIGTLDLHSSEPAAFSQDDITLFQTLADQLANTIQNAQLFTENTRLLNQAENNRRFLKAVIEHIPDPIFIKDKNHVLLEMNQANARIIGQAEQELLGKTDRDFLPVELAEKFYQRDNEVFTTNQIFVAEDKTVWGDGQEHTAYTRLIPIPNPAGQPEYLLGITQDVTESRAQEAERERLLAETAALYKGSRSIASALSERQIFEALFEQIRLYDPCEISAFRFDLVDNEPTWVELRVNWHAERRNNPSYPVGSRFYLPETPQTKLLSTTEPLFINEIATDHRLAEAERASFAPTGAHSVAILPLAATGQQLGAIMINFTNPFTFTEEIQRLWLAIADQVRVALANRQLIEEATYRMVRMETAAEVARAASSILDLQELLNSAVALICDRFDLYYVGAFLVDEAKEWAVLRAGTGEAGQIQLQKQHRLKIGGESMIGWSIYHRQPRIALDVGKEAVRFQNPDLPETRSEIALPLIYHQEAMGALTVQSAEQAAFRREDIVFLQTMADQLANAVVNARLYEQAQQEIIERKRVEEALAKANEALEIRVEARTAELMQVNEQLLAEIIERKRAEEALRQNESRLRRQNQTLVELASTRAKMLNQEDFETILVEITEATARTLEVERASVWLYDDHRSKISCIDLYELNENRHSEGVELGAEDFPTYFKALAEEHTIAAHDAYADPRTKEFSESYLTPFGITSMLDAPIWVGGRMLGVICHEHTGSARQWSIEEQNFAGSMADMAALAMEARERKRAEMALQQAYDELEMRVQERTAELATANAVLKEQIIERQRAEEALRDSETLYHSLVDNIPQNVFRKDKEGRFVFGNKSFCNSLAISLDELVGKTDFDFYPVELAEKYRQDDQKVLETGEIFETAEEHLAMTREKIYVRVVKSPIYDSNGEITGAQGIFWDITERKQAEEALRESEARFRSLASNIPGAVYRCALDANWTMEFMSAATEELTSYPASDFIGNRVRSYASIIYPEDTAMVEKVVLEGVTAKQPYTVEYRIIRADGQTRWVHERGQAAYGEASSVLWLDGVLFDITERKRAEEALAKQARLAAFDADVGLALTQTTNLGEALQNCVESVVQHLEATFARIWTLNPGENVLVLQASAGMYTHLDGPHGRVPVGMFKIGLIAQERRPHLTNAVVGDPRVSDQKWAKREGMVAFAGYPLIVEDRLVGVMAMFARKSLGHETLQAMESVANTIALAIERKQAEQALKEAFKRTQLLYNISEALATLINQQAAFETVLGEYLLLLNVSRGGIMLLDPAGETNTIQALYIDNKVVEPNLVFPAKEDLLAQYLQQNPFPLVIENVSTHALTQHNQAIRGHIESMLVVPVVARGEVVGIMGADAAEKGHSFSRDDIEIGKAIADQLAIWLENHQLLDEAQYRSERLQTVAEISRAASSLLDVNELINTSVNLIWDQFDFYYVGLFMVDGAREWAILRAGTGEAGRVQLARKHQLKIGGESMIGWCIQNRQARIALDVGQEAVRFQNPFLPDTHSEMALPLISRDEVIGALTVQSTERGAFSAEDITLLQTMADQLANAIENARLFESVTQAQREAENLLKDTQALQQFSQTLAGTLEVNQILDMFFEACAKVMGFEYAQFSLVDKYQNRIKAIAGFGVTESNLKHANQSLDSKDILVDIVKTGQTEIITGWDERFDREIFEAEGHGNWVRVFTPITLRQENIGLVEVGFNKNTKQIIQESQIRLLRAFIDQTALALDNAQRYEASQRAARREAMIKEITTKVRASTDVDTILQTTVKEVGDALGSKRAYVHLVSPMNGEAK